jgi:hypothetical protein
MNGRGDCHKKAAPRFGANSQGLPMVRAIPKGHRERDLLLFALRNKAPRRDMVTGGF